MLAKATITTGALVTAVTVVTSYVLHGRADDALLVAVPAGACAAAMQCLIVVHLRHRVMRLADHVMGVVNAQTNSSTSNLSTAEPWPFRGHWLVGDLTRNIESLAARYTSQIATISQERRELSLQLRISEADRRHTEAILDSIADAVIVTDAFNEVVMANHSAARVLDFELDDVARRPVDQVVGDAVLTKLIKDTREGGDTALRRHIEHRILHNPKQLNVYDVSFSCIASSQTHRGEPAGVVTVLRDITREKAISEMKSDFVSNVSHELRTPLSSIKAYVEMLVDGEADDEQTRSEFYNIIQDETNRLQRLIDNVLNISRIESGVVRVARENISLSKLVHEAVEVMLPQARAKNIRLVEFNGGPDLQILADKDMVYQATLNLLSNAVKYNADGGTITIRVSSDETARTADVSVTDTGVGIPQEDIPHVFDKFYRVQDHKKLAKGTGLGLALVKQIIETVHAGKLEVISAIGTGSTFTFKLPLADNG